ncbi:gas vesicle protein [Streptomyces sp. NPDC059455]|uniref:gas vesicle protein n=1 Tax=Streptomyces sp. NPDC059455 TaxID=3346837 RepID=UPI00369C5C4A
MTRAIERREVALVDLLDRVLAGGVVIAGEITLSIADIDLVRISLRALIASVRVENEDGWEADRHDRREGGPP